MAIKQLSLPMEDVAPGRRGKGMEREAMRKTLEDVQRFAAGAGGVRLRSYQEAAAREIVDSVLNRSGLTFVVMFPRQSGKNELQAQIEAYLLTLFQDQPVEMVKVSPTWKPQSLNAMRRLERTLEGNRLTRGQWRKEQGYIYRLGQARMYFLSGAATSNVVGATASLLLECDEAQDVSPLKWDKEINPMAASTNATRVFWGTAWTAETLLGRELRLAQEAERRDGQQRAFTLTAETVRAEAAAYGRFVEAEIARLGRNHPLVRTQYFCEELQAGGGMFPAERLALMRGEHPPQAGPQAGRAYAFLIDVGGETENSFQTIQNSVLNGLKANSKHDSTALTIVEIEQQPVEAALAMGPCFRTVGRRCWTGTAHTQVYAQIKALIELWGPQRVVIDATGIGAGLASFLRQTFGSVVQPFIFTRKSKSELGWGFLALIETGRYKEFQRQDLAGLDAEIQDLFFRQLAGCEMEALPGEGNLLRWGTPEGRGDPASGEALHDDLVVSAALCARLDERWGSGESVVIPPRDEVGKWEV